MVGSSIKESRLPAPCPFSPTSEASIVVRFTSLKSSSGMLRSPGAHPSGS